MARTSAHPRVLLLTLDAPPGTAGWPGPLAALPCLGGWLVDAAQGAWSPGLDQVEPWSGELSAFIRQCDGLEMGSLNLPGLWPPPPLSGWHLPRPPSRLDRVHLAQPPELGRECADLTAGLAWFAARRPVRPHQRDQRLAETGACAWLVREHACRLAMERPVAWLGVGFMGLREVWDLTQPQAGNLFTILLDQVDDHAAHLAQCQRPEVVVVLTGAGWAIRAAGRIKPGRADDQDPTGVLALLASLGVRGRHRPSHPAPPDLLSGFLLGSHDG